MAETGRITEVTEVTQVCLLKMGKCQEVEVEVDLVMEVELVQEEKYKYLSTLNKIICTQQHLPTSPPQPVEVI